jgi:DNA-binding SARP family transcriptional activator
MALLALRRVFKPVDADLICATNESITLNVEREAVDWVLFESLCARPDAASRLEGLAVYRGDLLATVLLPASTEAVGELLRAERERLRDIAIKTGLDLIAEFEDKGEPEQIGFVARKILSTDPTNEPAHRAVMRVHARAGDRPSVLRQYDDYREALREYGLDPSADITAIRDEAKGKRAQRSSDPAAQPESPEPETAARTENPTQQRGRPGLGKLLLGVLAIVALALTARPFPPCAITSSCDDPDRFPMIVLSLGSDADDPQASDAINQIRSSFEMTLGRVSGATVITRAATAGELPVLLDGSYIVDATVVRAGEKLRIYVELRGGGDGATPEHYQYDTGIRSYERLADRLEADLIPALRSRIQLDHSPG